MIIKVGDVVYLPKKQPNDNRKFRKIEIADDSSVITLVLWGDNANREDLCEGRTLLLIDGRINEKKYLDSGPQHNRKNVLIDSNHPRSNQLKLLW